MEGSYMILRRAYNLYLNRDNICYFYGAKGQVMTDAAMDALIKAEPEYFAQYSEDEIKKIRKYSKGKIGYDCSGFVGACVGVMEWSGALWSHCVNKTTVKQCKAGSILYRKGHVGIDLGYGMAMDVPKEMHSIEIFRNSPSDRKFTGAGEYYLYDYSEANNY